MKNILFSIRIFGKKDGKIERKIIFFHELLGIVKK